MKRDIIDGIVNVFDTVLGIKLLDSQYATDLKNLGLDSIDFVKVVVALEQVFNVEFPVDMLMITLMNSVEKIAGLVELLVEERTGKDNIMEHEICIDSQDERDVLDILCISNISTDPFLKNSLVKYFGELDKNVNVTVISIEQIYNVEIVESIKKYSSIILWINLEELCDDYYISLTDAEENERICVNVKWLYDSIIKYIKENTAVPIMILTMEDLFHRTDIICGNTLVNTPKYKINSYLTTYEDKQIIVIDFEKILVTIGLDNCYNNRYNYSWNCPYSLETFDRVAVEIVKQYKIFNHITPKCIVLDCDNVLWGGVLNEEGIEKIALGKTGIGKKYHVFQKFIKDLYLRGVILAVCSKNEYLDIEKVFDRHSGMIIKKEDIACFQVNWNNKVDNIRTIADNLNIGLNSMVFIDDSYFEVEAVKQLLPEVRAFLFDEHIYTKLDVFCLPNEVDLVDVRLRHETYKTNQKRAILEQESLDYNDYLERLNTEIDIHESKEDEYNRISELSLRVNKCTNGKRYSLGELENQYLNGNNNLYSIYVKDVFGDLGLVGAIGIEGDYLDLFCLSCRALGRNVEDIMLKRVMNNHNIKKGFYYDTGKNTDELFKKYNIMLL